MDDRHPPAASRHNTYTVAQLRDINAAVTAIATAAAGVSHTLNGALVSGGVMYLRQPMLVSVTTSASGGSFVDCDVCCAATRLVPIASSSCWSQYLGSLTCNMCRVC